MSTRNSAQNQAQQAHFGRSSVYSKITFQISDIIPGISALPIQSQLLSSKSGKAMSDQRRPSANLSPLQTPTTPTSAQVPGTPTLLPRTTTPLNAAVRNRNSPVSPTSTITSFSSMIAEVGSSNNAPGKCNSNTVSLSSHGLESTLSRTLPFRSRQTIQCATLKPENKQLRLRTGVLDTKRLVPKTRRLQISSLAPPPPYHLTIRRRRSLRSYRPRRAAAWNPAFVQSLQHLCTPLIPLVSVSTGLAHPEFPTSLLQYHLLTHEQVDDLARWYHQVSPPVAETWKYPCPIPGWVSLYPNAKRQNDGSERV